MIRTILKDIKAVLKKAGFAPVLDKKLDILTIEGYSTILIDKEESMIGISFACGFDATIAAIITKTVVIACHGKYEGYDVDVLEPYLNLVDDQGRVVEVLFGDEAVEAYNKYMQKEEPESRGTSYEL